MEARLCHYGPVNPEMDEHTRRIAGSDNSFENTDDLNYIVTKVALVMVRE